jgi:hypothetical protein
MLQRLRELIFGILPVRERATSKRQRSLGYVVSVFTVLAVAAGFLLLLSAVLPNLDGIYSRAISAAPLLLIGLASVALQIAIPLRPRALARHLAVAIAFLLWGIDELLPPNVLAQTIGHVVIFLYVIDLALALQDQLPRRQQQPWSGQPVTADYDSAGAGLPQG